ncbi:deoxyribose-phosphate aldolase [Halodesulfurarchaeum formicicum]|uniref:Deoxyribose-phosphate aldolase n=1 Tax=Halodesulfurarchaeum formicicum TaxID=1873524 RepID=A0A1D8S6N3_9EURY|nr:deoxyribose-phosphate aldolase [Halodesulfurarchaeum formicicum]AOW81027.1 deoxyribose-phosphate aldolase [Halodesulfurarchaeum formicicum]
MNQDELAGHIDHTVLGPETTKADVRQVIEEAEAWGMNVCIPPCYVAEARDLAEAETTIATVIGFPHGQHDPAIKREEAVRAVEAGADELDVVLNVGRLQAGETQAVTDELAAIVEAVGVPVKVIVEAPLLSEAEKHAAGEAAVAADVDFLKTATGFADGGATVEDVELLAEYRPVKASGGIGSYEAAMAMLEAGAERIGASSGVEILSGAPE